jgi:hypothetical protein
MMSVDKELLSMCQLGCPTPCWLPNEAQLFWQANTFGYEVPQVARRCKSSGSLTIFAAMAARRQSAIRKNRTSNRVASDAAATLTGVKRRSLAPGA